MQIVIHFEVLTNVLVCLTSLTLSAVLFFANFICPILMIVRNETCAISRGVKWAQHSAAQHIALEPKQQDAWQDMTHVEPIGSASAVMRAERKNLKS